MTKGDADSRHQLARTEGLRQVVVGADVEGSDLVVLLTARTDDDDRLDRDLPEVSRHVHPVHVREAEIEENEVGVVSSREREPLLPCRRLERAVAGAGERSVQELL